ncbi:hypothetical protein SAY86_010657 [Trapa natans]|uniref:Uncharacterized protein n=1 Tax=Trapa natans TaxID=22666 RepID=A0AAN7LM04_TRANT|nr:hypothetical protein SAY86_010657 [Trapa natans]
MGTEESKDPFKGVDWKAVGNDMQKDPGAKAIVKKRLPKKIRQIPEYYFLPRRSMPSAFAFYGACIAGGVGAGMLLEIWIRKKVEGWKTLLLQLTFALLLQRMEVLYGSLTSRACSSHCWLVFAHSLAKFCAYAVSKVAVSLKAVKLTRHICQL